MFDELNEQLAAVIEKRRERQKLLKKLSAVEGELVQEQTQRTVLHQALEREGADIGALEGLSLTALFHTILGDRDRQLERERQEYLAAKLKFDACEETLRTLTGEKAALQLEIAAFGDVDREYRALLEEKEQTMLREGLADALQLAELDETLAKAKSEAKELREAVNVGVAALDALEDVRKALSGAQGWGAWDLLGGGLLATAIKHGRINQAKKAAHRAQQALRHFQWELADLPRHYHRSIDIDIGSFAGFADYFFDGLIVDWVVQSRIVQSLAHVNEVRKRVLEATGHLRTRQMEVDTEIQRTEAQRQHFIEYV